MPTRAKITLSTKTKHLAETLAEALRLETHRRIDQLIADTRNLDRPVPFTLTAKGAAQ